MKTINLRIKNNMYYTTFYIKDRVPLASPQDAFDDRKIGETITYYVERIDAETSDFDCFKVTYFNCYQYYHEMTDFEDCFSYEYIAVEVSKC